MKRSMNVSPCRLSSLIYLTIFSVLACSGDGGDDGDSPGSGGSAEEATGGSQVGPGPETGGSGLDGTGGTVSGTGGELTGAGGQVILGPVDCNPIAETPEWDVCGSTNDSCTAVFTDSAGCAEVCAAAGLVCSEVWENVDPISECAPNTALPALSCDAPSGHQSDYCVCVRGDEPPGGTGGDAGTGGADGGGGQTGTGGTPGAGGSPSTGGNPGTGGTPGDDCPNSLVGWAAVNGDNVATTTGGGNASPVRPSTSQQLIDYAGDSQARVIEIEGAFNIPSLIIASNKTLVGIGNNATINGGLRINGSNLQNRKSNVIVRNLRINATTAGGPNDGIEISYAHHVWIDHCEIWDAPDGNLDIVRASDYVTVSWTKFWYSNNPPANDHRFCNLIGNDDDRVTEDSGRLRVTMHHNWWGARVHERMPRVRFGQVHVFNNYFSSSGNNYCVRAGRNARLLVQNNYFHGVNNPQQFNNTTDQNTAHITANGNTYDGTSGSQSTGGGGTPFTSPPYSHSLETPSAARQAVQACSGPR